MGLCLTSMRSRTEWPIKQMQLNDWAIKSCISASMTKSPRPEKVLEDRDDKAILQQGIENLNLARRNFAPSALNARQYLIQNISRTLPRSDRPPHVRNGQGPSGELSLRFPPCFDPAAAAAAIMRLTKGARLRVSLDCSDREENSDYPPVRQRRDVRIESCMFFLAQRPASRGFNYFRPFSQCDFRRIFVFIISRRRRRIGN